MFVYDRNVPQSYGKEKQDYCLKIRPSLDFIFPQLCDMNDQPSNLKGDGVKGGRSHFTFSLCRMIDYVLHKVKSSDRHKVLRPQT